MARSAMMSLSKEELVEDGSRAAIAELRRRGRDSSGRKVSEKVSVEVDEEGDESLDNPRKKRRKSRKAAHSTAKLRAVMKAAAKLRNLGYSSRKALSMAWAGKTF